MSKWRTPLWALFVGIAIACAAPGRPEAQAQDKARAAEPQVLIKNVRVWDGKADSVSAATNVLVTGNKITKIGNDAQSVRPRSSAVETVSWKWVSWKWGAAESVPPRWPEGQPAGSAGRPGARAGIMSYEPTSVASPLGIPVRPPRQHASSKEGPWSRRRYAGANVRPPTSPRRAPVSYGGKPDERCFESKRRGRVDRTSGRAKRGVDVTLLRDS